MGKRKRTLWHEEGTGTCDGRLHPGWPFFCVIRITGYSPQAPLIARNQFQAYASWSAPCSRSQLSVGTVEFEDALGVAADYNTILFDQNTVGVKARSIWGV